MKLFFDARFTRVTHHDGISRYGACLLTALAELTDVTAIVHDPRQLEQLPSGIDHVRLNAPTSPLELNIAPRLNRLGADVVFSPMQVMGSAGRDYGLILTLHDLIYYRHRMPPTNQPSLVRAAWRLYHSSYVPQRLLLNRADVVATVSQTTKSMMAAHRLTRRPVVVIPNAADLGPAPARHPGAASRDLLYMGSFMPYKNVETLLWAMRLLPDHTLHLLSHIEPWRLNELRSLVPAGARVVFHDGVSDAEYLRLLRSSHALLSASLDEGFGLPAVEAMSQGLPVVLSDIPAFAEVAGPASSRFRPHDVRALARAVQSLSSPDVWQAASAVGREQALRYTWERSALRLFALANKVHEIRGRRERA